MTNTMARKTTEAYVFAERGYTQFRGQIARLLIGAEPDFRGSSFFFLSPVFESNLPIAGGWPGCA